MERVYLDIPFEMNAHARARGARFDTDAKRWYCATPFAYLNLKDMLSKDQQTPTFPLRAWLNVPYALKDMAKQNGARYDPDYKSWYAPTEEVFRAVGNCTETEQDYKEYIHTVFI